MIRTVFLAPLATTTALPATALAQGYAGDVAINPEDVTLGAQHFSPFVNQSFPNQVFWGDTHLHTSYSTDAGMIGCRIGPEEAYRFAMGESVVASGGVRA
ncbi:MAG: DUF3604 domain-containing protein, partial [Dinoroseobacter sp.]|nr:DUF3604 domain-containing protein [Dinoroseobacter sp.]